MTDAARRAELNRQRVRRWAARLEAGRAIYRVEIGGDVIDMLARLGWLQDTEATDRQQVSAALAAMLRDAARR